MKPGKLVAIQVYRDHYLYALDEDGRLWGATNERELPDDREGLGLKWVLMHEPEPLP